MCVVAYYNSDLLKSESAAQVLLCFSLLSYQIWSFTGLSRSTNMFIRLLFLSSLTRMINKPSSLVHGKTVFPLKLYFLDNGSFSLGSQDGEAYVKNKTCIP